MYVLVRKEDGSYVAKSGNVGSYTKSLERAQKFTTEEQAAKSKCGNEYIRDLNQLISSIVDN